MICRIVRPCKIAFGDAMVEGLGLATPKATVLALDEHGHE